MYSIPVGWYRPYIFCGASALAIDPSGWRVLLVSLIPLHLQAISYIILFFSLTTDMNRVSQNLRVPTARGVSDYDPGVRVHYFLLLAVCQFPFVFSRWLL